jgi:hypothetical protein
MTALNDTASAAARAAGAHAMTDVTGFGLLGHLHSLGRASGVAAVIDAAAVPAIDGVLELLAGDDAVSGGSRRNRDYAARSRRSPPASRKRGGAWCATQRRRAGCSSRSRPRPRRRCRARSSARSSTASPAPSRCDDRPARAPSAWSGPGPVAHPVFKTGGARHTALEGSTPSPFRMSDRDPRTLTGDAGREAARAASP